MRGNCNEEATPACAENSISSSGGLSPKSIPSTISRIFAISEGMAMVESSPAGPASATCPVATTSMPCRLKRASGTLTTPSASMSRARALVRRRVCVTPPVLTKGRKSCAPRRSRALSSTSPRTRRRQLSETAARSTATSGLSGSFSERIRTLSRTRPSIGLSRMRSNCNCNPARAAASTRDGWKARGNPAKCSQSKTPGTTTRKKTCAARNSVFRV